MIVIHIVIIHGIIIKRTKYVQVPTKLMFNCLGI